MKNKVKCCPTCNYIVSNILIEYAIADFECPHCGYNKLSSFYKYGSKAHRHNLSIFKNQKQIVNKKGKLIHII